MKKQQHQHAGSFSGEMLMTLKHLAGFFAAAGLAIALVGCGDEAKKPASVADGGNAAQTLKVGVSPVPGGDLMKEIAPVLAKEGIRLESIEFSDYIQPNLALADGSLDANLFQHKPYMDDFAKEHSLKIESLASIFIAPIGIYSKTLKSPQDIGENGTIAIPNDPTNGSRALLLLEHVGLLKLRTDAPFLKSPADIADNPKKLKIIEVEAAQLPRSLEDVSLAVINCNFALGAGLNPIKDAIAIEAKDSPYANIVAVRSGEADRPELQALKRALTSPEIKKFIEDKYQGSLIPTF